MTPVPAHVCLPQVNQFVPYLPSAASGAVWQMISSSIRWPRVGVEARVRVRDRVRIRVPVTGWVRVRIRVRVRVRFKPSGRLTVMIRLGDGRTVRCTFER